ncbi:hypothetical protein BD560DRAFT_369725 [Blakeslea trispora]|nr:hypothetical protein BD560DRAFT_369725 [Blakeslea trispora]
MSHMPAFAADSRTGPSAINLGSSSFLYHELPPPSPILSSASHHQHLLSQEQDQRSPQQQQQQKDQEPQVSEYGLEEKNLSDAHLSSSEDNNNSAASTDLLVNYLVSPRPSTNCLNNDVTESYQVNKRRTSSSSTSSSGSFALKSTIKLASEKDHVYSFQVKTPNSGNKYNINNTKSNSKSSTHPMIALKTPTVRYTNEKRKSSKIIKKEKLKEAKNEYEGLIEEYVHQLTIGCQQRDCRNKFCASGRGGIISLQPQAALIMAIQLASMPCSKLCRNQKIHQPVPYIDKNPKREQTDTSSSSNTKEQTSAKPFLQSLFTSTSLSNLMPKQNKYSRQQRRQSRTRENANTSDEHHWVTDVWRLVHQFTKSPLCHSKEEEELVADKDVQEQQQDAHFTDRDTDRQIWKEDHIDPSYYQLDQDDKLPNKLGYSLESDSSSTGSVSLQKDMLLAILPASVSLDVALDYFHKAIISKTISEEKMDMWCRSVFQNWEGIGNSFLASQPLSLSTLPSLQHKQMSLINLEHLSQFFERVIGHSESENARQIRIIETISDSLETLLDRMALNVDLVIEVEAVEEAELDQIQLMMEWCRSIMAIFQWLMCCKKIENEAQDRPVDLLTERDTQEPLVILAAANRVILTQKTIQVLSKIAQKKKALIRKTMHSMLTRLNSLQMNFMVKELQKYLLDHYHTSPYKHGLEDTVVMALKCLELFYQSNMENPSMPIISPTVFYGHDICKRLNIKNEYRIWKQVLLYGEGRHTHLVTRKEGTSHQKRSRLFMTTSSTSTLLPYPFENEYQFSWFSYPFLLPPSIKRKIVLIDAMSQMSLEYEDACVNHTLVVHAQKLLSEVPQMLKNLEINLRSATCPYLLLEIRREHFIMDTLDQISRKWSDLKKPLKVKFIEGGEEGMDQGGVQKEFFGVLFEKVVASDVGLFMQDDDTRLCWIRPVSNSDVRMYEMIGVMMGLSVYNGVIMNLQFPKILWKILVMPNETLIDAMAKRRQLFTLEDLEEGWPTLGHGLRQLLEWKDGDVEDIFCRDYEISMNIFGQGVVTTPLMSGKTVPVTNDNREAYVQDYCLHFMYTAQKQQLLALRRGIWSVIGSRALSLCTADELEMVACGLRQGPGALSLNMIDLENVAEYDDGYSVDHPTIRQFWSVVHNDFTNEQKKQLLLFVTASDRVPVGGLKELTFYIQRNGPDSDRLPTALTCFSRLLLPEYATRQKLRDRLVTAIENTKGFGLV